LLPSLDPGVPYCLMNWPFGENFSRCASYGFGAGVGAGVAAAPAAPAPAAPARPPPPPPARPPAPPPRAAGGSGHPAAAIQTFSGLQREDAGDDKPFQLDRCHALETTTDTVQRYYPKWYRGAALTPTGETA